MKRGVRVLYLGRLASVAGMGESEFVSSSGDLNWPGIVALLNHDVVEGLGDAVCEDAVKVALNGELVGDKEGLIARDGDEVAFLPPVSGG